MLEAQDIQATSEVESLRLLRLQRADLLSRRQRSLATYRLMALAAVLLSLLGVVASVIFLTKITGIGLLLYGGMIGVAAVQYRGRIRDIEASIQDVDFQIDLQQFEVSLAERRAEKLLRINDFQLRRYYDLNLSQNRWIFSVGVCCLVVGGGVIGATLYLVLRVASTPEAQTVTAILGGTGALFANVVGGIYLKMSADAGSHLTAFHAKLVETNRLLLANLLASRIDDSVSRGETLARLAVAIGARPEQFREDE